MDEAVDMLSVQKRFDLRETVPTQVWSNIRSLLDSSAIEAELSRVIIVERKSEATTQRVLESLHMSAWCYRRPHTHRFVDTLSKVAVQGLLQ